MNSLQTYGIKDLWWTPILIIVSSFGMYCSCKNNTEKTNFWFFMVVMYGFIPLWAIVSKHSKNILFDGMIYDVILFMVTIIIPLYLQGSEFKFNSYQYCGLLFVIIGFLTMRLFSS